MLKDANITDPRLWQLLIEMRPDGLCAAVYSLCDDSGMEYEFIPTVSDASSCDSVEDTLRRIEDAVYDHDILLQDFRKVAILTDTRRFMAVPDMLEPETPAFNLALRGAFQATGRSEILSDSIQPMNLNLAFEMRSDVAGFLRRTFHNAAIRHVLTPLSMYFSRKYMGRGRGKTLVNLEGERMDMIVLGNNAPLSMSMHTIKDPLDAVYYILAVRQNLGLPDTEEVLIAGEREMRAAVTAVLRRHVRYVMPAIFPAVMLKGGRGALDAPFPLVLSALT